MYFKIIYVLVIGVTAITTACSDIEIITRDEWGARSPTQVEYAIKPVSYAIIHNTDTPECFTETDCISRIFNIQHYHMNEMNFHDIGYNFLIGNDGKVYEGVGWHKVGAHTRSYNSNSVGIAFIGNFAEKIPNSAAIFAAKKLLGCGVADGELAQHYKLLGARQVRPTSSPGLKLYREIKKWPHWSSTA